MVRLPTPGGDDNQWGDILNDFLVKSHTSTGTLKPDTVGPTQLQDNSVTSSALAPNSINNASLADNSVTTPAIADTTVTKVKLSSSVQASLDNADAAVSGTAPDATTTTKGLVQLAGDLSGTATSPTVPGLASKAPLNSPTFTGTVTVPDNTFSVNKLSFDPATQAELDSHTGNVANPHSVTKSQVGLSNVDNTSDASKPVSTAQATAINAKVADSISDSVNTIAPSQNAVFDALALKADTSALGAKKTDSMTTNKLLGRGTAGTGTIEEITLGTNLSLAGTTLNAATGGAGEANTASNVGTAGIGVFKQKAAANLEFKKLNAGSNKITLTDDTANSELDIDVNTANLGLTKSDVGLGNVDNTSDASKPVSTAQQTALNAKANNSTTIAGANSVAGGGDLSANRTLSLVNDSAAPGNSQYYGTNGSGAKGYFSLPSGGSQASGPATITRNGGGVITAATVAGYTIDTIVRDGNGRITSFNDNGTTRTITRNGNNQVTAIS